jgi:hypothetical protein
MRVGWNVFKELLPGKAFIKFVTVQNSVSEIAWKISPGKTGKKIERTSKMGFVRVGGR